MTKEDYINEFQTLVTQEDLDNCNYALGDALYTLRGLANGYDRDFNDDTPRKMVAPFITQQEAAEIAQTYLDSEDLLGLQRFLQGSWLYDDIVKLNRAKQLEDTSQEEILATRDKIVDHIKNSNK